MNNVSWGKKYLDEAKQLLEGRVTRQVLIVGVVVAVGFGGYYANRYFSDNRQRKAVEAFDDAMQTYYTALATEFDWSKKDTHGAWDEVELAFQTAYQQNGNSSFAPFFLIYQAKALIAQEKHAEAAKIIAEALGKLSKCSPFYFLYKLMHASVLIDAGDESGISKLKNLADNPKNTYPEMIKYYLAQYYLSQDQASEANKIFEELAASKNNKDKDLPWVNLAKDYVSD